MEYTFKNLNEILEDSD